MLSKSLISKFKALPSFVSFSQSVVPLTHSYINMSEPLLRSSTLTSKHQKPVQSFVPLVKSSYRPNKQFKSFFKAAKRHFSTTTEQKSLSEAELKELKKCQNELNEARVTNNYTNFLNNAETILILQKKSNGENYEGLYEDLKNVGWGNLIQNKHTEALFYFDEALKQAKKEIELLEVNLYMGQLYIAMNNPDSAVDSLDIAYIHAKTLFSSYLSQPGETLIKIAYFTINVSKNLIELYRKKLNNVKVKIILSENMQMFNSLLRTNTFLERQNIRDFMSYFFECCEEMTELAIRQNELEEAEKSIAHELEVIKIYQDHFYLARALFNQGLVFSHQEKHAEAIGALDKAREVLEQFFESKPQDTYNENFHKQYITLMYMVYGGLSNAHFRLGNKEEGLKVISEIENFYKTNPTDDPFFYDHIQTKKAEFFIEDKKFEDAFPILESISTNLQKSDMSNIRNVMFKNYILTLVSNVGGEVQKFEEALKAALENESLINILIKQWPNKKDSVADNKYAIGALYGKLKKFKEAQKYLKDALEMYKGMEDRLFDLDRIYLDLATICEEEGDKDKARQYLKNSMEIKKKLSKRNLDLGMDQVKEKLDELKPEVKKKKK